MKKIDISTPKHPNTFAIVDDEDFEWLNQWKWRLDSNGYADRMEYIKLRKNSYKSKRVAMHRLINNTPDGMFTDHINRNKLDNRKSNLRNASKVMVIKNRIELAEEFARRGYTKGAEIGVANGAYAEILCKTIPKLEYHGIDVWAPVGWRTQEHQDKEYVRTQVRLVNYNAKLYKETSVEASLKFKDKSLDFCFLDGAHDFDNVMLDIILWSRKVRKGGIVSLHDYYNFMGSGVIEAVDTYCKIHRIKPIIIPEAPEQERDNRTPCAWWEKT